MKRGICITPIVAAAERDAQLLCDLARKIKDLGTFEAYEFYFNGSQEDESRIGETLDQLGLYPVLLSAVETKRDGLDLVHPEQAVREAAISRFCQLSDSARRMGAKKILIASGPAHPELPGDLIEDCFVGSLEQILAYSSGKGGGVEFTLEFFNTRGDPYLSVGDIDMTARIASRLCPKYSDFAITFDTSHVRQIGADLTEALAVLAPYVRHIHMANCVTRYPGNPLNGDKHPPFGVDCGDFSELDMVDFLRAAADCPHLQADACSIEVITGVQEDADQYLEDTVKSAQRIFEAAGV